MKKVILSTLFIVAIFCFATLNTAQTEPVPDTPHVVYTYYDGVEMTGLAEIPDGGEYYVRLTFFIEGDRFFILFAPIDQNGEFHTYVVANCERLVVQVVDNPHAIQPGSYTVYDILSDGAVLW